VIDGRYSIMCVVIVDWDLDIDVIWEDPRLVRY